MIGLKTSDEVIYRRKIYLMCVSPFYADG